MENKRTFKPVIDTKQSISTGKQDDVGQTLPIGKSLDDIGLESANAQGEATIKKPITTKAKRIVKTTKAFTLKDYENHKKIEVFPNVFIILEPNSKVEITNFADFIHVSESTVDIVDIIPVIYPSHYEIIKHSSTRFMVDDLVTVNFKYKSLDAKKAEIQSMPNVIQAIKFVNLNDRTAVIAYLQGGDFYSINELDHYDTD